MKIRAQWPALLASIPFFALASLSAACSGESAPVEPSATEDALVQESDAVTLKNWKKHPAVKSAQAIKTEVDAKITRKTLRIETEDSIAACTAVKGRRELCSDKTSKKARRLRTSSTMTLMGQSIVSEQVFYYAPDGALRLAEVRVDDTLAATVYFDKAGKEQIFRLRKEDGKDVELDKIELRLRATETAEEAFKSAECIEERGE